MIAGLSMLLAKIAAALAWFGDLFVAIFLSLWDMVRDVFPWLFEQCLDVAISAVGAVDVSALTSQVNSWGSLPADVLNILALLGVGVAVGIITAAIGIRIALQLIPFTRLGS